MLQSPLKKSKHTYPLDFSSRKKQVAKERLTKYDKNIVEQENPENKFLNQKNSQILSRSSVSQLFMQSNQKHAEKFMFEYSSNNDHKIALSGLSQSPKNQNSFFQGELNFEQTQEPLKQVRKKTNRIIVDENMLKNPRIQINEDKAIKVTQRTIQTQSPQKGQKTQKQPQIGSIRRQSFKNYEQFEEQKQNPLLPQKPFNITHKNTRRNSLLQKLNINKIHQKSSSNDFQRYINSQIMSGTKTFRPQTYTYANKMFESQHKLEKQEKIRKINSSFDAKKKEKIVYMNNQFGGNLSFNLPNLGGSGVSFRKNNDESSLKSKFKYHPNSFFANNRNLAYDEGKGSRVQLEPSQISKLKAQINMIAQTRFKNKEETKPQDNTQRQFTFQGSQQNFINPQPKQANIVKSAPKKPLKKLQITYHVPLANLKRLCRLYLSSPSTFTFAFKVPKVFMEPQLFNRSQQKPQLHENALYLFESLKINSKDMVIKRYSNCCMFICGHVVVMWYYSGKRYLGGWQYEYLDEGVRHGLGLEWEPEKYIYYGEWRNNKKHGLGALKQGPDSVTVGYWVNGKYVGTTFRQENELLQSESDENRNNQDQQALQQQYDQGRIYEQE